MYICIYLYIFIYIYIYVYNQARNYDTECPSSYYQSGNGLMVPH